MRILKLLKLISETDDDNLVSAEKLFVANRVLSIAYQQIDDGTITVDNLSSFDEQTGKEQVYFTRDDASLYRDLYAKMFRPSFQNNNLTGDDYAEEEEDDDSEGS